MPQPVGTGFFWAGQQQRRLRGQLGLRQLAPGHDAGLDPRCRRREPEGEVDPADPVPDLLDGGLSTSCANQYFRNHMGEVPPGFEPHPALEKFGNKTTLDGNADRPQRGRLLVGRGHRNTGNCWFDNTGPDGTRESLTARPGDRPRGRPVDAGVPAGDCASSMGSAGLRDQSPGLLVCFGLWETDNRGRARRQRCPASPPRRYHAVQAGRLRSGPRPSPGRPLLLLIASRLRLRRGGATAGDNGRADSVVDIWGQSLSAGWSPAPSRRWSRAVIRRAPTEGTPGDHRRHPRQLAPQDSGSRFRS